MVIVVLMATTACPWWSHENLRSYKHQWKRMLWILYRTTVSQDRRSIKENVEPNTLKNFKINYCKNSMFTKIKYKYLPKDPKDMYIYCMQ